ncbi:MAG: NAD+ synthase [Methylococcaceae bacterium]
MKLRIALAQLNFLVGDMAGNTERIIESAIDARDRLKADAIVFSELAITGYPPEDLLLRSDVLTQVEKCLQQIIEQTNNIVVIVGFPEHQKDRLYNCAAVIQNGQIIAKHKKNKLPNYSVFDEKRYFSEGNNSCIFDLNGFLVGLSICEDIWSEGVIEDCHQQGAELIVNLNASPFYAGKIHEREAIVKERINATGIPVVYVNQIGGQDELLFDGASFVMNGAGEVIFRAKEFEEQVDIVTFDCASKLLPEATEIAPLYSPISSEYKALLLGIRDYVQKNGFVGVVLGLSGGIDSALTFALAVDALGSERVEAYLMPSRYTQAMSIEDAEMQANTLHVKHHTISIEPAINAFNDMLKELFAGTEPDATEENIQARCRGIILMASSNKSGKMLLTTGNKSEMSVGYATLYGDMAGGFAPLKDVPKMLVYQLAEYRNSLSPVIPERVITRPPSAELAPDQLDEDSLPPYSVLDPILQLYIEQDQSIEQIIAAGFTRDDVIRAIRLVDRNEYKRRQSPPGIRISPRAFGRDRRYPITSGYRGDDGS